MTHTTPLKEPDQINDVISQSSKKILYGSIGIYCAIGNDWNYATVNFSGFNTVEAVYYAYNAGNSGCSVYQSGKTASSATFGYKTWFGSSSETIRHVVIGT